MYADKTLVCEQCQKEFVFSAGEQEFYAEKGFENEPKRCPECRRARKEAKRGEKQFFPIVCEDCGKEDKVPFQPKEGKAVYCSECYAKRHGVKEAYAPETAGEDAE